MNQTELDKLNDVRMKLHDIAEDLLGEEYSHWFIMSWIADGQLVFTIDTHDEEEE